MDKAAIVTGASGVLGGAIARRLGVLGYNVVVNYNKNMAGAEKTARDINMGPGKAAVCKADVRNFPDVQNMVKLAVDKFGRLDAIVCNAGGSLGMITKEGKEKLLLDYEEAEWDLVIETNIKGTFNCIKAAAPTMIKQGGGHIVIVASGTGLRGGVKMSSYAAAKAGEIGLMKAAARELGEHNIKINALCPGRIIHGGVQAVIANYPQHDAYLQEAVLHRNGDAEEFGSFVGHLVQMENISGQVLNLDSRILF